MLCPNVKLVFYLFLQWSWNCQHSENLVAGFSWTSSSDANCWNLSMMSVCLPSSVTLWLCHWEETGLYCGSSIFFSIFLFFSYNIEFNTSHALHIYFVNTFYVVLYSMVPNLCKCFTIVERLTLYRPLLISNNELCYYLYSI